MSIEITYDKLMNALQENIRGKIAIHEIYSLNDIIRNFICKLFAEYNPDRTLHPKAIIDKWQMYDTLSQLQYGLHTFAIKSSKLNDKINILISHSEKKSGTDDEIVDERQQMIDDTALHPLFMVSPAVSDVQNDEQSVERVMCVFFCLCLYFFVSLATFIWSYTKNGGIAGNNNRYC